MKIVFNFKAQIEVETHYVKLILRTEGHIIRDICLKLCACDTAVVPLFIYTLSLQQKRGVLRLSSTNRTPGTAIVTFTEPFILKNAKYV